MRISKEKASFRAALAGAELSQRRLARFLGKDVVTVNRWCQPRPDSLPVPKYARAFVSVYRKLSPEARRGLRVQ